MKDRLIVVAINLMKNYSISQSLTLLISGILLILSNPLPIMAQNKNSGWTEPYKISHTILYTRRGLVTTDTNGRVHFVWAERLGDQELSLGSPMPNVIFYRYLDGQTWSQPVDILTVKEGRSLWPEVLRMDENGRLILLWQDGNNIWMSVASVDQANYVKSWQTSPVIRNQVITNFGMDLDISQDGVLWIASTIDNRQVFIFESKDKGNTWSVPRLVGSPSEEGNAISHVRLATSGLQNIHITWTETSEDLNWLPSGIWYAGSQDGGKTWSTPYPLVVKPGHAESDVNANQQGEVHVFWNRRVGSVDGRYHTWSLNNGATWTEPEAVFPGVSGLTGSPSIMVDSQGNFHLVSSGRLDEETIFYSSFDDSKWTDPIVISGDLNGCEQVYATLNNGNFITAAWIDFDTEDIWYSSTQVDAPWLLQPTLSTETQDLPTLETNGIPSVTPTPIETAISLQTTPLREIDQSTVRPVYLAGSLVVLLIVCVVIFYFFPKRYQ